MTRPRANPLVLIGSGPVIVARCTGPVVSRARPPWRHISLILRLLGRLLSSVGTTSLLDWLGRIAAHATRQRLPSIIRWACRLQRRRRHNVVWTSLRHGWWWRLPCWCRWVRGVVPSTLVRTTVRLRWLLLVCRIWLVRLSLMRRRGRGSGSRGCLGVRRPAYGGTGMAVSVVRRVYR